MKNERYLAVALMGCAIFMTACSKDEAEQTQVTEETKIEYVTSDLTGDTSFSETFYIVETEQQPEPDNRYLPDKVKSRYGYYQLTEDEKQGYDRIKSAAELFQTTVEFETRLPKESMEKICEILILEENDLYYLAPTYEMIHNEVTGLVSQVVLNYQFNSMTVDLINSEVDEKTRAILLGITSEMSNYDIIKYFHDVIITNCDNSVEGDYVATPYGAFIDGKALCEGYSRALAHLCNKVGIENIFATGVTSEGENHMWNMVKIEDQWYNIDLTWDDPNNLPKKLDFMADKYISYDYFLYPTAQYGEKMIISDIFVLPQANSTEYNYYVKNNLIAATYEEAREILRKEFEASINENVCIVNLKISDNIEYKKTVQELFTIEIYTLTPSKYQGNSVYGLRNDDLNTFQIILK